MKMGKPTSIYIVIWTVERESNSTVIRTAMDSLIIRKRKAIVMITFFTLTITQSNESLEKSLQMH